MGYFLRSWATIRFSWSWLLFNELNLPDACSFLESVCINNSWCRYGLCKERNWTPEQLGKMNSTKWRHSPSNLFVFSFSSSTLHLLSDYLFMSACLFCFYDFQVQVTPQCATALFKERGSRQMWTEHFRGLNRRFLHREKEGQVVLNY
jgi:hypothetical protein